MNLGLDIAHLFKECVQDDLRELDALPRCSCPKAAAVREMYSGNFDVLRCTVCRQIVDPRRVTGDEFPPLVEGVAIERDVVLQ